MTQIITAIIAIAKAIPVINSWIEQLVVAFTNSRIETMKKENIEAIKKAIENQDQRDLETATGSTKVGELSGVPGSTVVNKLPGVK